MIISKNEAVRSYGARVSLEAGTYTNDDNLQHVPTNRMGYIYPELDELSRQQTTVDKYTVALRALNEKIAADTRVDVAMVPIGDGLTLAIKR